MPRRVSTLLLTAVCLAALTGCEQLGIENPEKVAASREADGKAVGAACRHAGRAIEDCYALNPKAVKAAVFAGWKEMNDYMRENKIDSVAPQVAASKPKGAKSGAGETAAHADEDKTAEGPDNAAHTEQSRPSKGASRARG